MTTTNVAENKLLDWADTARRQLKEAEDSLSQAQEAYEVAKAYVDAIQMTLEFGRGLEHNQSSTVAGVSLSAIAAQDSHMDALKLIARHGDGLVRTSEAANALKLSGRSQAKRRSLYSNLYHQMEQSDEWEPAGKGMWRLKNSWSWDAPESDFPDGESEQDDETSGERKAPPRFDRKGLERALRTGVVDSSVLRRG